jgi:tryptophan-rich sensory protein
MAYVVSPLPLLPSQEELASATVGLTRFTQPARVRSMAALAGFGALTALAAVAGAATQARPGAMRWYRLLAKSRATPPDRAFAVVWPPLYALSAISGWCVWDAPPSRARSVALGMWTAQLVTNAAWSPVFFGARRPRLALGTIVALGASLVGFVAAARKVDRRAAWMTLPYLAWTGFAGYLNATIVAKNAGPLRRALLRG